MIDIWRKIDGAEVYIGSLADDNAEYEKALMGVDEVRVSVTVDKPLELQIRDYIHWEGTEYTLNREPNLVKASVVEYRYDLVFESPAYNLMDKLFRSATGGQSRFTLTGSLEDFVDLLLANINRQEFDSGWEKYVDEKGKKHIVDTELKNLSFESISCYEVLSRLANEFAVEYRIIGRKIAFEERVENLRDLTFEQGCGNGLYTLSRQNVDTENTVTRAYVYGSMENLPVGYRDRKYDRLVPADEKGEVIPYFENTQEYAKVVERDVFFDDVKPSFTGGVEGVSGTHNKTFSCSTINFDLNDKAIAVGDTAKVNFLTGALMGIGFRFSYNHARHEVTLIEQDDETAAAGGDDAYKQVPNAVKKPAVGDKFNFTGINLPGAYVTDAEKRLAEKGRKWMDTYSKLRVKYNLDVDYRYLRGQGNTLEVGDVVHIVVPDGSNRQLRITALKKQMGSGKLTCEVSNFLTESWEKQIEGKIQDARSSVEISKSEVLYSINATKEWVGRYFARLAEQMVDGEAIVWDDNRHEIKTSPQVPDSVLWNGLRVPDWLDQQVRTVDQVKFRKVTAEEFTEETNALSGALKVAVEEGNAPSGMLYEMGTGIDGLTLGALENVSELADEAEDGCVLVKQGEMYIPVKLDSIGGNGGVNMKLKSLTGSILSGIIGGSVTIGYQFSSVYSDDNSETGPGSAVYVINSMTVATKLVEQGEVYLDITGWLNPGTNKVVVTVTDSTGLSHSLNYTVEMIRLNVSSTFDSAQVFTGRINYRYTPVGALEKTIHFVLDGRELEPVVSSASNRQMNYEIPAQPHGSHSLKVYITAVVNGTEVRSNELNYDLICVEQGNTTPVIASPFMQTEAEQYEVISIPFTVYRADVSTADISILVNDVIVSEQTVDRTLQNWTYRLDHIGSQRITIACGGVTKQFGLVVTESSIIATPESRGLELYLTAANRSNNDRDRESWVFNEVAARLTGFNYKTNGWMTGLDGSSVLRVAGDARVEIPFQVFGADFRTGGKTVEFEFATTDVTDYDAVIIDCMNGGIGLRITAQNALFASEQTSMETKFKEDERVRVSFVVEEKSENRLIYTYINGIMSGVFQYPAEDNFMQKNPVNIRIGSNDCTVDIYNIRIYENKLSQFQMLDNFIGDLDDFEKKQAVFIRNQIFNEYGNVMYDAVVERIPCMIITGNLPSYKGDKKTVGMTYTDRQNPDRSFSSDNVQIDVQGTSSQYYPRKNYKTKHKGGFRMARTGETVAKYALRDESIAVDTFCEKADFAESSGTHNTGMAKLVDRVLRQLNFRTPPQKVQSEVRTTVDGFPIAVFHRLNEADSLTFVGKYNFNNDKSTQETFGFSGAAECWEVCNNTSDRTLFKVSDYSTKEWLNDFEGRYPEGNTDYTHLKVLTDWLVSTRNDPERFRNEVENHFNKDFLLFYYIMTEVFAMVDQRAKNMMLASWGNEGGGEYKWYPIFYDNDTVCGVNNEGALAFSYNVEYHDTIGTQNVFNGEQSVLWNQVESCFAGEIAELYYLMRSRGYISYDNAVEIFNKEQSDRWCEAIYNMDSQFKYIDPLIEEGNASYLYAAQGSRKEHRTWWLFNRFHYMDSKYTAGDFLSDYATMRLYTPSNYAGVVPDADFRMIPFANQYVRVKYGSYMVGRRSFKDEEVFIEAPDIQFNDTETIIYGASGIKSLGDLSGKYAGTIDVSKAVRLRELKIGSGAVGYQNTNLTVLSVGNNKMLRSLDIRNCPNLRQPLDLSGCENIERIYAQGTGLTSVVLPKAGVLSELYLPETISNLTLQNQPNLTDATLDIAGVSNLTTIRFENMNQINVFALLDRCFALDEVVLARVRLVNISGTGEGLDILTDLAEVAGMDENGNNTPVAVVIGKYRASMVCIQDLQTIQDKLPELEISYDKAVLRFEDPAVESICLARWDKDKDGYLAEKELSTIESIANAFNGTGIKYFDELKYFSPAVFSQRNFQDCKLLEKISLPSNITEIPLAMFWGCSSLKRIDIPVSVSNLGLYALKGTGLVSVHIPSGVKWIGPEAFADCHQLRTVTFEEGIQKIERGAFNSCSALQSITLPSTVTILEKEIFRKCSSLMEVIILSKIPPELKDDMLPYTNANLVIYVPNDAVQAYKTTSYWSNYASKIRPISER